MKSEKLILVTNDDSVSAKGIHSLVEVAAQFGRVVVVAPDKPQSGMGHAITIGHPLRLQKNNLFGSIEAYACSGTPVDCVKLAIYELFKGKPDLILSGINHGENTSTNVLYSGTMSAAIEGAMEGIPSIGFSLADYNADADFEATQYFSEKIISEAFKNKFPKHVCLNVNVPNLKKEAIKGIKITQQAHAFWADSFLKREDQFGKNYYWLTGEFSDVDQRENTDLQAMKEGFVSIVPTQFDLTAYYLMNDFKKWKL